MEDVLTRLEHPRARGEDDLNVTAFLESQKDWDFERDHGWTGMEFLFIFDCDKSNFRTPLYEVDMMYDEGRVVLDLNNHPIKAYQDIPLTLSTEVEGGLLVAIRGIDPRISNLDLWARVSVSPSSA